MLGVQHFYVGNAAQREGLGSGAVGGIHAEPHGFAAQVHWAVEVQEQLLVRVVLLVPPQLAANAVERVGCRGLRRSWAS